jgi:Sigma-70 region 2
MFRRPDHILIWPHAETMESGNGRDDALVRTRAVTRVASSRSGTDLNPRLLRYLRILGCDDPDDVASESWLQAVRDMGCIDGGRTAEFRVWLFTIASTGPSMTHALVSASAADCWPRS